MKRPAAARSTARPPSTDPVKQTKSMPREPIIDWVDSWERWRNENTDSGRPARRAAASKRSAQSGVCALCLRITELPASSAGTIAFTAVRYG